MLRTSTLSGLTAWQRQRGIQALMISTFFTWAGFFMVIPLMAIHYVDHLGWAASLIGIVLAVRQFTQQGLTTLFGVLSDRIGPKPLIVAGMFGRAVGFSSMAYAETFGPVMAAAIVVALGGAMIEAPKSAALAALATPETRQRTFSLIGVIGGVGTTVGTQLGALLLRADFALVCIAGGGAFLIVAIVVWAMMPPIQASVARDGTAIRMRDVVSDRVFMLYLVILSGYWFAWAQFGLTIVLAAADIAGSDSAVAWIYFVNAAVTVGLGYALPRLLERWLAPLHLLILGTMVIGLGLLAVGFAVNIVGVLVAAAVFSLGAVLARPGQETVTANLADPAARGTYFGVAALSVAVGGGLGNYAGGLIYGLGQDGSARLPWLIYAAVAVTTAVGLWFYREQFSSMRAEPAQKEPVAAQGSGWSGR